MDKERLMISNSNTLSLIGIWQLLNVVIILPNNEILPIYGCQPLGYISYSEQGIIIAQLMPDRSHRCINKITPISYEFLLKETTQSHSSKMISIRSSIIKKIFGLVHSMKLIPQLSYSGHYKIDLSNYTVIHELEICSKKKYMGKQFTRRFIFDGGYLHLIPINYGFGSFQSCLTWEQIK